MLSINSPEYVFMVLVIIHSKTRNPFLKYEVLNNDVMPNIKVMLYNVSLCLGTPLPRKKKLKIIP